MELAKNKKAFFDYDILEKFEAGLILLGWEAKSLKAKKVNLTGGHVHFAHNEAWLTNVEIQPYQPKNQPEENGKRKRKLLLNKREIAKLENQAGTPGVTVIPLRLFTAHHRIKVEIGVCRGKKQHDKRDTIKKRDLERSLRRRLK